MRLLQDAFDRPRVFEQSRQKMWLLTSQMDYAMGSDRVSPAGRHHSSIRKSCTTFQRIATESEIHRAEGRPEAGHQYNNR